MRLGEFGELQPVMRDHRLVGGDEALARRQRRADSASAGPSDPPTSLDHHIHICALRQRGHVVFPREAGDIDAAILAAIPRAHRHNLDPAPRARGNQSAVGVEQPDDARTDRAETGNGDPQRIRGRMRAGRLSGGIGQAVLHQ
jgi:hypothetical protein